MSTGEVSAADRIALVERLRTEPISGRTIDLIPYAPEYAEETIAMRNTARAKHFLTQKDDLTLEGQAHWYETVYLPRNNDLQWLVLDKAGRIVGTNALYDIDIEGGDRAEKGRQIVREEYARLGPYALEADYLACRLSFDDFGLQRVVASVRPDNGSVISMNERMGFSYFETRELRGTDLRYFQCRRDDFDEEYLSGILDHFVARSAKARGQADA